MDVFDGHPVFLCQIDSKHLVDPFDDVRQEHLLFLGFSFSCLPRDSVDLALFFGQGKGGLRHHLDPQGVQIDGVQDGDPFAFTLKNWFRCIQHEIFGVHLRSYLDEFKYRFNQRNRSKQCFSSVLLRIAFLPKYPYPQLVVI